MKKQDERTPEEIAKDLEDIDFAEIDEGDLKEVFGGLAKEIIDGDCNCNGNCNC
jgi:hypothetical protein